MVLRFVWSRLLRDVVDGRPSGPQFRRVPRTSRQRLVRCSVELPVGVSPLGHGGFPASQFGLPSRLFGGISDTRQHAIPGLLRSLTDQSPNHLFLQFHGSGHLEQNKYETNTCVTVGQNAIRITINIYIAPRTQFTVVLSRTFDNS